MTLPNPKSFIDVVGTVSLVLGFVFAFLAIRAAIRDLCLRVTGMSFIIALSLFANHTAVYFAAVFIVATGITSVEFLQNLAAIIRGSKEYFEYRKTVQQQPSGIAAAVPAEPPPPAPDLVAALSEGKPSVRTEAGSHLQVTTIE